MKLKAVRGTKDIFGEDVDKIDFVIETGKEVFGNFAYKHLVTPTFEETSLFKRGIGEETDIVEKEMYTFEDKGGRSITLRPEGTASVVRSYLEHKIYGKEDFTKYFYYGPMFRYERPQAGRYREFYQIGAEAMGSNSPVLDAEIIYMAYSFLNKLGIEDIEVQINSVGCKNCRKIYREKLQEFLKSKLDNLCGDCKIRAEKNPLRVLDCKIETCREELKEAPILLDYLDEDCASHFEELKKYLEVFEVPYVINKRLVRGLDYYTNTVFEIVTNKLGSQGTILAGGRYNNLIEEIGQKDVPAIGFAAGVERVSMLLGDIETENRLKKVYIAWLGDENKEFAFQMMKKLRDSGIKVEIEFESKSIKAQMKKAGKLGVKYTLIIGEEEKLTKQLTLKDMDEGEQKKITIEEIIKMI